MGILSRLFGGSSARPVPIMAAASQGAFPSSGGDDGGHGQWRSLGPMPVAVSRFRPVVQTARFESSLTTRSRPTTLAPLVHNRSAQYLSGVVEGIAVALPAVQATRPPATPPPADAAPRVGVVQRFTRPWYRFTGGDGGAPNPVADATPDSVPAVATPGTADQTDEPGLSQQFLPSQPPETAGLALPEEPATVDHSLPLVVAQNQAPVAQTGAGGNEPADNARGTAPAGSRTTRHRPRAAISAHGWNGPAGACTRGRQRRTPRPPHGGAGTG